MSWKPFGCQAGTLWPALRDWLAENDNLQGLWGGLAWQNGADISGIHDLVGMTHTCLSQGRLPPALLQHHHVAEALGLALSKVLPKGFARDQGDDAGQQVLEIRLLLLRMVNLLEAESTNTAPNSTNSLPTFLTLPSAFPSPHCNLCHPTSEY